MLDLHSIYKTFNAGTVNEKTALNGLNLHLNEGDFVTVIGGNGAGKSTMLNAVAGTWFVDEGKIKMRPAVELSYLDEDSQRAVVDEIDLNQCTPSHDQTIRMRKSVSYTHLTLPTIA